MPNQPAMSPRNPPPPLKSTVRAQYGTGRRIQSVFQTVALARGFTIKAGLARRERLVRGIPQYRQEAMVFDTGRAR